VTRDARSAIGCTAQLYDAAMDAESWLADFATRLGVPPLSGEEIDALLNLARVAAHESERKAAPVACFLAARAGLSPADAFALVDSGHAGD
jgi:hypothetical protein